MPPFQLEIFLDEVADDHFSRFFRQQRLENRHRYARDAAHGGSNPSLNPAASR
jgi:hypothetical protein